MINIHFSRPQRGASGSEPLAVRRIGRLPFMAVQNPERKGRSATRLFFFEALYFDPRGDVETFMD